MHSDRTRQVVTVLAYLLTLALNTAATTLPLGGLPTNAISDQFHVFVIPAGYVFSIWGLIYTLLGAFTIWQALPRNREDATLRRLGSLPALLVTAAVFGFFMLAALPVAIATASEEPTMGPQVASTAVGVMLMAGNLGGAALVAVMGVLKDAQGNFAGGVALTVVLALAVAAVAATVPEPLRGHPR